MINFRFHLVSITAVFLALAIGVVMGSAVIDQAIVDGLRSRIDQVERNADARRSENIRLNRENDRLNGYVNDTAAYAVTSRLTGRNVVLFAWRGVNDAALRDQVALVRAAGGSAAGIVWFESAWALEGDQSDELARALGTPAGEPDALRAGAITRVAQRVAVAPEPGAVDVLDALTAAGFLRFEPVGDQRDDVVASQFVVPGSLALVVTGTEAGPGAAATFVPFTRALVDANVVTVAAEYFVESRDGAERGALVKPVRDDPQLASRVSTVDDVDLVEGRVAAILALSDGAGGRVGNYGYGDDTRSVPEWTRP